MDGDVPLQNAAPPPSPPHPSIGPAAAAAVSAPLPSVSLASCTAAAASAVHAAATESTLPARLNHPAGFGPAPSTTAALSAAPAAGERVGQFAGYEFDATQQAGADGAAPEETFHESAWDDELRAMLMESQPELQQEEEAAADAALGGAAAAAVDGVTAAGDELAAEVPAATEGTFHESMYDDELKAMLAMDSQQEQEADAAEAEADEAPGVAPAAPAAAAPAATEQTFHESAFDDELRAAIFASQQAKEEQEAAAAARVTGGGYAGDAGFDDMLEDELDDYNRHQQGPFDEEEEEMEQQQQQQGRHAAASAAAAVSRAAAGGKGMGYEEGGGDAEEGGDYYDPLEELDWQEQTGAAKRPRVGGSTKPGAADDDGYAYLPPINGVDDEAAEEMLWEADRTARKGAATAADADVPIARPARLADLAAGGATGLFGGLLGPAPQRPPPRLLAHEVSGASITVTATTGGATDGNAPGRRVYCSVRAAAPADGAAASSGRVAARPPAGSGHLLSEPIEALLAEVEQRQVRAVMEESARVAAEAAAQLAIAEGDDDGTGDAAGDGEGHQLWVDKYSPAGFTQLLSDEWVNREVAKWTRSWLPGAHRPEEEETGAAAAGGGAGGGQKRKWGGGGGGDGGGGRGGAGGRGGGRGRGGWRRRAITRQEAPLLLICGPPGTGKTTLAHVVAAHCGFRVVEINASDDRSAAALVRRVQDTAQMKAVLDASKRPNCIVIDEIDGATGGSEGHGAVSALVKLVLGSKGGGEGSKKRPTPPLGRPVICLANDLYAPALRPLRDAARVITFRPPAQERLVERLSVICRAEGLGVDRQALQVLAERCRCDIRACLNTLQLLARQQLQRQQQAAARRGGRARGGIRITAWQIESLPLGQKDFAQSALGALRSLIDGPNRRAALVPPRLAAAAGAAPRGGVSGGKERARGGAADGVGAAYSALMDFGDNDFMMAGLHEHACDAQALDVDMSRTAAAAEALSLADVFNATRRGGPGSGGGGYVPACLLAAAAVARRGSAAGGSVVGQLRWPRAQADCARRQAASQALLKAWSSRARASAARTLASSPTAALQLAHSLKRLSRPGPGSVRGVVPSMMAPQERALLEHMVNVMAEFGLTFSFPAATDGPPTAGGAATPAAAAHHGCGHAAALLSAIASAAAAAAEGAPFAAAAAAAAAAAGKGGAAAAGGQQALVAQWALPRAAPLSPPLDLLDVYAGLPDPCGRGEVPLVVRQLVARGVQEAALRRSEMARLGGEAEGGGGTRGTKQQQQQQPAAMPDRPRQPVMPAESKRRSNWLDDLKRNKANSKRNKAVAAATAAAANAAGAAGAGGQGEEGVAAKAPAGPGSHVVLYRFNEGYTNAVKRPLAMRELLD